MWEYVLGGATVFGLIVTLGAWLNGRITRREVSRLIAEVHRATRELIAKMDERLTKMDDKMDEGFAKMDERFAKMDERFELLLRESSEAHSKILEVIRELASRPKR